MITELFQQALHINAPWFIKSVDFNADKKRLDIYIDFKKGSTFVDPDATSDSAKMYKAYDTVQKTWQHLNFFLISKNHQLKFSCRTQVGVNCQ